MNGCGGGCNCTWIILIVLFLCCCCGKNKSFSLCVNPCCLILMFALLYCCGGIRFGKGCM
ncbi:MAG: chorion class high-cysteine HCB protein 13 [Clostridia bacterium]|nr:chorion class high-cysteine HCB protein 13 [Clostridia bacterium]